MKLKLKKEPKNEYDAEAIMVKIKEKSVKWLTVFIRELPVESSTQEK